MFIKGLVKLCVIAAVFAAWKYRQFSARKRLREFDAGRRCVACDGTDMTIAGDLVRCNGCNYSDSLNAIAKTQLSDREIAEMTRPS
ncbi:MAG: hypothetical protein Q8Q09_08115 [Deltaproteobacteria bacterium]|nr:hypothetical protein [Deltaproteobacteria bacterium]